MEGMVDGISIVDGWWRQGRRDVFVSAASTRGSGFLFALLDDSKELSFGIFPVRKERRASKKSVSLHVSNPRRPLVVPCLPSVIIGGQTRLEPAAAIVPPRLPVKMFSIHTLVS
jgi:hypothetical protein